MSLARLLGVEAARGVWLVGAGGKTTTMNALAAELASSGRRVVTTTSTRILPPPPAPEDPASLVVEDAMQVVLDRLSPSGWTHRTVAAARRAGKLLGHAPADLDRLVGSGLADHVLVEADGAAGRPLKAHRDDEPVLGARCDRVIAVVGLRALGRPLDERTVYRTELASRVSGVPIGAPITPSVVAALLASPGGWLSRLPTSPVTVLLAGPRQPGIDGLLDRLRGLRGVDRLAVGDLRGRKPDLRSV